MTSEGRTDQKAEKNTLSEFVEKNNRLLSAVGLFTALTIFATNLEPRVIGAFLSFLLLSATVMLWMELLEKFPASAPATAKLTWFETTLSFALLVVVFYWLLQFQSFWRLWLMVPIALVLAAIFSAVLKRFNVFNRAFSAKVGEKRGWRYLVAIGVVTVSTVTAIFIASLIAESFLGPWLDFFRQVLEKMSVELSPTPTP